MIGLELVVVEKFFRRRRRRRRRRLGVDLKKLDICSKHIGYRHFSSRGCFWGKKAEGLLKTLAKSSKNLKFRKFEIPDRKSAGVEIDPTPRGIIFSLFGFPGGATIKTKVRKVDKKSPNPPHSNRANMPGIS